MGWGWGAGVSGDKGVALKEPSGFLLINHRPRATSHVYKSLTKSAGQRGPEGGNLFDNATISVTSLIGGYTEVRLSGDKATATGEELAQTREADLGLTFIPTGRKEGQGAERCYRWPSLSPTLASIAPLSGS